MTDFADQAAEYEAVFMSEALSKHQTKPQHSVSLSHCEDCGSPIPEARQKAVQGCTRCVLCQEYYERGYIYLIGFHQTA